MLFVGCRRYTAAYPRLLERAGAKCWTIDIDPDAVRWGAPGHHVIGGIEQAGRLFPRETFDTVVLSGVFGFGLDSFDSQDAAITGVKSVIKHGGWFILGWNKDRVSDVHTLPALVNDFAPSCIQGFSEQREFADSSHVYSFYEACHHARSEAAQVGYAEAPSLLGKRP